MIEDETSLFPESDEYQRYVRNKLLYQIRDKLLAEGWMPRFRFDPQSNITSFHLADVAYCVIVTSDAYAKKYCQLEFNFVSHPGLIEMGWKTFMNTATEELFIEHLM